MHAASSEAATQEPARASQAASAASSRYWLFVAAIVVVGLLPRLPLLSAGFVVDDYAQLAMMRGDYPVARGPLELFTFSDGSAREVAALRSAGFFPWWTAPDLKLAMFRPLSCALMWLDRALFGDTPAAALGYHLHSFAWWVAMVLALAWLLRDLVPAPAALLALGLFVLEDCHVLPLAWIALRNALVSSTFALLALRALLRVRRAQGDPRQKLARALVFALLALAAGEYALPYLAFAMLYELAREASPAQRLRGVSAIAALGVSYLVARRALGFGSRSSEMYVDPSSSLWAWLHAARERVLALFGDLALGLPSGWWSYGSPFARPSWHGDVRPFREVHAWAGALGIALLIGLTWALRRSPRTRALWPLPPAAALALVPGLGTFPDARMLLASQVGLTTALAALGYELLRALREDPRSLRRWTSALALAMLVLTQSAGSVLIGAMQVDFGAALPEAVRRSILGPPFDERMIGAQHLLLMGAADVTTTIYVPLLRREQRRRAPASCHLLTAGHVPYRLHRESANAFTLERLERVLTVGDLYGSAFGTELPALRRPVSLGVLRVTPLRARDGMWTKARFEHALSLDDPSLLLLVQTLRGLLRIAPPPIGGDLLIPAPLPPLELRSP